MTTGKFFSAAQMASLQKIAMRGMTTDVQIFRRTVSLDSDPYGSSVSYETITPVGGCIGWLHSTPTPVQQLDSGMLVTFNTYRLYVPVDTDIRPGDRVKLGSVNEYNVSDTTNDETWPAVLAVSLRLRE